MQARDQVQSKHVSVKNPAWAYGCKLLFWFHLTKLGSTVTEQWGELISLECWWEDCWAGHSSTKASNDNKSKQKQAHDKDLSLKVVQRESDWHWVVFKSEYFWFIQYQHLVSHNCIWMCFSKLNKNNSLEWHYIQTDFWKTVTHSRTAEILEFYF